MLPKPICLAAVLVGIFFACQKGHAPSGPVGDIVVRNAHVYTVDAQRPWAQAVAIKDDRIVWMGDEKDAEAHAGPTTKVIDAGGRMLLPGFIDSHFHVLLGGNPNVLRIENGNTLAEIQRQVHEFAMKRPELKWIEVEGWNYSAFPRGTLPSAKDLAGLTGGRPAFLVAYDYHTIWMNREALREFGITRATRKVIFAEHVEKDPKTAEPTGILTGFGSTGLSPDAEAELRKHLPSHTPEAIARNVHNNLAAAVRAGITTVVDPQSYLEDLDMYARLRREGKLLTRLQVALFHRRGTAQETLQQFEQARQKYDDDWLRVSAVKLYIDDVIEPHTAGDSTANQRVVGYRRRQSIWTRRFARIRSMAHSRTSSSKIGDLSPPGNMPTWSCCRMICSKFQRTRSRTRILCGRWWEEKPCGANNRQRFFR